MSQGSPCSSLTPKRLTCSGGAMKHRSHIHEVCRELAAEALRQLFGWVSPHDGKLILQQCATEREILVYRFDGKSLTQDKAATIPFESRPGSIATSVSR